MRDRAEEIYENMRHYPPSNRIWERWHAIQPSYQKPPGVSHRQHTIDLIQAFLEDGYTVKYGWCGSPMVRTFREKWIFYKKTSKQT